MVDTIWLMCQVDSTHCRVAKLRVADVTDDHLRSVDIVGDDVSEALEHKAEYAAAKPLDLEERRRRTQLGHSLSG
jgi:hypothetical protein